MTVESHVERMLERPVLGDESAVMVRMTGARERLDEVAAKAHGPCDVPPVDFLEWAEGFEELVREGMDPLTVRKDAFRNLHALGVPDPEQSLLRTWDGCREGMGASLRGRPAPGVLLPAGMVDPSIAAPARRAAFLAMVEEARREARGDGTQAGSAHWETTAFSLASLLPLPAEELQPTWAGRDNPGRGGVKLRAWGAYSGLHYAQLAREADGTLRAVGLAKGNSVGSFLTDMSSVLRDAYDVDVEVSTWGNVFTATRDGRERHSQTHMEWFAVKAAEGHGVRSASQLAQLLSYGRHAQVAACLGDLRAAALRPSAMELAVRGLEAAAVRGMLLKRRILGQDRSLRWKGISPQGDGEHAPFREEEPPTPPRL